MFISLNIPSHCLCSLSIDFSKYFLLITTRNRIFYVRAPNEKHRTFHCALEQRSRNPIRIELPLWTLPHIAKKKPQIKFSEITRMSRWLPYWNICELIPGGCPCVRRIRGKNRIRKGLLQPVRKTGSHVLNSAVFFLTRNYYVFWVPSSGELLVLSSFCER
ncbi:hypothetical protein NPIL_216251 [Nephila pilipes]|uniref:Uncharacterized protein n=1 Tax=Nephila pilipes TaxID=299642 RepID=A0A8X6NF14_NEPPI|nr:hypothetical protein NPIL_216251 [Nephila pilipes]